MFKRLMSSRFIDLYRNTIVVTFKRPWKSKDVCKKIWISMDFRLNYTRAAGLIELVFRNGVSLKYGDFPRNPTPTSRLRRFGTILVTQQTLKTNRATVELLMTARLRLRQVTVFLKSCAHWQQSWIQHGRLCWKSTVAEIGNKSATKSTVADTVNFVADTVDFVSCVYGDKATRSTLNKVDCVEFNFVASVYRA